MPPSMFSLEREIPMATFACVLIKNELIKEGLDEAYLMGTFEDVDFCSKARFKGWKIIYCPQVTLYHYESATQSTRLPDQFAMQQLANARRFAHKWNQWLTKDRKENPGIYNEK
jgi:GT2 family glycosyltransferase